MRRAERVVIYIVVALGLIGLGATLHDLIFDKSKTCGVTQVRPCWIITTDFRTFAGLNLARLDETTRNLLKQAGFNDLEILNYIFEHCGTGGQQCPPEKPSPKSRP